MKPPATLETKRLNLRQPVSADANLIFEAYAQDLYQFSKVAREIEHLIHISIQSKSE
jgi:hypothetical protein